MTLLKSLKSKRSNARKAVSQSREAVDQLRAMRNRLKDERRDIERRPHPLDEAKRAAEEAVHREAEKVLEGLNLASLMSPDDGREPDLRIDHRQIPGLAFAACADGVGLAIKAKLEAEYADRGGPMSAADKAAELERIDSEILAVELAEEGVIRELEAAGFEVARRPDADPRALLAAASELE